MASDSETDERFAVLGESENEGSEEEKEGEEEEEQEQEDRISPEVTVKKKKPGVIYLSRYRPARADVPPVLEYITPQTYRAPQFLLLYSSCSSSCCYSCPGSCFFS